MKVIASFVEAKSSLIVEGVHLSLNVLLSVVEKFPNVVPFLIYIKKEDFHRQRFAVRAKYMTTDPGQNKYISNFDAIRAVQNSLSVGASEHLIPKIDNRNIDRSIETMHQTLFSYLKKLEGRQSMFDPESKKLTFLDSIWKRRKQKQTSKSKTLKAITQLQNDPDIVPDNEPHSTPFEDMLEILPSEKVVFKDVVSGNDISYMPSGTMIVGTTGQEEGVEKQPEEPVPANGARKNKAVSIEKPNDVKKVIDIGVTEEKSQEPNEQEITEVTETEADPVEITLTDFAETTDFVETTDTENAELSNMMLFAKTHNLLLPKQ